MAIEEIEKVVNNEVRERKKLCNHLSLYIRRKKKNKLELVCVKKNNRMAESSNQGERMQALALVSADELKRELQRKAKCIVEDDDYTIDDTEEVMDCLSALKDLKLRPAPPPQYLCPISHQLMKDPVVLASGQVIFNFCLQIFEIISSFIHYFFILITKKKNAAYLNCML